MNSNHSERDDWQPPGAVPALVPAGTTQASGTLGKNPARRSSDTCVQLPWLFSPAVDIATFAGSALIALLLLAAGAPLGLLVSDSPEWTWITTVLLIDVAHVYATAFRVYLDPDEFQRRRGLFLVTPVIAFAIAWAVYSEYGPLIFWRALAYLAVFHFIRQQYGWVALYRRRAGERDRVGHGIDSAAIYAATLYPLVWWHAHLPRRFGWFLESSRDFLSIPASAALLLEPIYWCTLLIYLGRSLMRGLRRGLWNPGKDIVVGTTAVCWYLGIITFNSDYAFTVTNVVIHGIPYMVLVYWTWSGNQTRQKSASDHGGGLAAVFRSLTSGSAWSRIVLFLASLWLLAFVEELLWDRGVWHERSWLFGSAWETEGWRSLFVPLLAVPQMTHYILDGFIWKRRSSPTVNQAFSPPAR